MERLNSIDELEAIRERIVADRQPNISTIIVSAGTCGQASGANDLIRAIKKELLSQRLIDRVHLRITGCHGFCQMEPSVLIEPGRLFYPRVGVEEIKRIVDSASSGDVLEDLLPIDPTNGNRIESQDDVPFFRKQIRTILGSNEKVDPIRIYNYVENDGYSALCKVFATGDPHFVVEEVKASGLRGRGGAGFRTGVKWEMLADRPNGNGKYVVCNADEGDPGAYMDRSVLEGNPHSIIEGMIIGAYGTGATNGVIYVRNEYPLAIKHLVIALRQARAIGLLGTDILGSGFSFDIKLVRGAGAFVCGEETALMKSIEGKMGEPRQRPPFPVHKGIDGKPTVINNVETWANIPVIFREGAVNFSRIGTKNNSGTKIFSLVGKIRNTGLVEVPMGMTIRELVYDIGGGPKGNARIKAVQTGGPSGGCIPAELFDLAIDYDSLAKVGSIMGSGGMIVMDDNTCMVDVAKYFMGFLKDESCGKCFTCRKGTQRMHEILDDVSRGIDIPGQLDLLEELAETVKDTTMCGLGQTASNPVFSTLRYFRKEYERHIADKQCDAFVCTELVGAPCQTACPLGTEAWQYVALIEKGHYEEAYQVIREPNPFPSVCARVCDHRCEYRCRLGASGGDAVAIRALKRFVTDRVDPLSYEPKRIRDAAPDGPRVAVIGAGPGGLSAAHALSLLGYRVTVFEAEKEPGGMLVCAIPAYRLPRDVLRKEIACLVDENVSLQCNIALGRDVTIDSLFRDGFKAIFLAMGAHKSWRLGLEGEDARGVYPSMQFLKAYNLRGEELARGKVGVIGGGNSAVDAARVALRQKDVDEVTILYRRTRGEMPAYDEEIEEALLEGIRLKTLVSPSSLHTEQGCLVGIECLKNELGEIDASGRRRPIPIQGSEVGMPLDTLIVAIGERPDTDNLDTLGIDRTKSGTIQADPKTFRTNLPGVFAGGDVVSGPNTVVDAIAAGKQVAVVIDRYFRGEELIEPPAVSLPRVYVEPVQLVEEEDEEEIPRATSPMRPLETRKKSFTEVEMTLSEECAHREARRCLRCDLEFTQTEIMDAELAATGGNLT